MLIFPRSSQPAALFIICLFSFVLAACDGNNPSSSAVSSPVVSAISPASVPLADATLTSISIAPASAVVSAGSLATFVANGIYSDGTTRNIANMVAWKSDRAAVATINKHGIATAIGEGSSMITATLQNIVSAPATFTIAYSVGGNLSGLAADSHIILSNNGTDKVSLAANGAFSFPELQAKGSAYKLSISALPTNQPCTHTYGAGKVQATNMPGMSVICGFLPRGELVKTSALVAARRDHATTLLANGKILATGGVGSKENLSSTELYDPAAERWTATGALTVERRNHTATLLPNGKVLAVGGLDNAFTRLASTELYDSLTGQWSAADNIKTARSLHTATLLANGKVLVTGGVGALGVGTLASAELYDPATGHWTETGSLAAARTLHTALLLPSGKVLVSGGVGATNAGTLASAELYDPSTGRWTSTGNLNVARSQHSTTLLPNGHVLVAGGIGSTGNLASTELYNPSNGRWAATGDLTTMRFLHTANLLPTGKVLVVGGVGATGNLARNELYDPESGRWTSTGNLNTGRSQHTATLLSNGKLLVTGGNGTGVLADAELYW